MRTDFRRVFWIGFTVGLLLLIFLYVIVSHTNFPAVGLTRFINRTVPQHMNLNVSIGEVRGDLFNGLDLADITVYTSEDRENILQIKEARLRYHLKDLLAGKPIFSAVTLVEPIIVVDSGLEDRFRRVDKSTSSQTADSTFGLLFGVENLRIRKGKFSYRKASGERFTFQDIDLTGGVRGDSQNISGGVESLRFHWLERDVAVEQLCCKVALDDDSLSIDSLAVVTANSSILCSGHVNPLSSPTLRLDIEESILSLQEVGHVFDLTEEQLNGTLFLEATLIGPLHQLRIETRMEGSINGYAFDSLEVNMVPQGKELDVQHFDLRIAETHLFGSGTFVIRKPVRYTAAVAFEGFDLSLIKGVNVISDLNGNVKITGQQFSGKELRITAELDVRKSSIETYTFDSCVGSCHVSEQTISAVNPVILQKAGLIWKVQGEMHFDGTVEVMSEIRASGLEVLTHMFRLPSVRGQLQAEANVTGSISNPNVDGDISLDSLAYKHVSFANCRGSVHLRNTVANRSGFAEIKGVMGRMGRIPIDDVNVLLSFGGSFIRIDSLSASNNETAVEARGNLNVKGAYTRLDFTHLESRFRDYMIANTDTVSLLFQKDGAVSGEGRFKAGEGSFDFVGSVDSNKVINTELVLKSLELFPIMRTLRLAEGIRGTAEGTFSLMGTLEVPRCDLAVTIWDGEMSTVSFDTLRCMASYSEQRADILRLELVNESECVLRCHGVVPLQMKLSGGRPLSILPEENVSLTLNMTDFHLLPISDFIGAAKPFKGSFHADMKLERTLSDPDVTLTCSVKEAQYDALQLGHIRGLFKYDTGRLNIHYLESSYEGTEYASTGVIPLNLSWPYIDPLSSEGQVDLSFGLAGNIPAHLITLFTDEIRHLSGDMDARFALSGALRSPVLNGDFSLKEGLIQLTELENPMTDVEVQVTIDDTLISVDRFVGKMGKGAVEKGGFFNSLVRLITFRKKQAAGQFSLRGTVDFADVNQIVYDLGLKGERLFVRPLRQDIDLFADVDLLLSGEKYPHISGDIIISQGFVREVFKPKERVESETTPSDGQRAGPSLDLNVHIPGHFWVEGSDYLQELSVELKGELQVLKQRAGPEFQFFGTSETMRGKYHIYGNVFRITQGNIHFGGISEFNPELNVEAETQVGNEPIYLNLSGTLLQPEVKLRSESGYSEKDIISLLTLGWTTTAVDTVGVSDAFESKAANVLGNLIEGELARKARQQLGVDTFEITSGAGSELVPDNAQVTVGKYLSPKMYLEYSRRLAAESEQEIELEYRLNRHLSFLGTRDRNGMYHLQLQFRLDY